MNFWHICILTNYNIFSAYLLANIWPVWHFKTNMVKNPNRVMASLILDRYFEKFMCEICVRRRIAIWGLRSAQINKLKKADPHFFLKNWGSVFFNFLIQALLRPQIAIKGRGNISRVIIHSFKQCKISYNLIKFCRIWEFKVSKESEDNFYACVHFLCR